MAKNFNRIDLKLSDFAADFEHRALTLARKEGIKIIQEVQAIPYPAAPVGTVVLQFSPTKRGRLLIGHNPIDWEWTNRLVATRPQLKLKALETNERRPG